MRTAGVVTDGKAVQVRGVRSLAQVGGWFTAQFSFFRRLSNDNASSSSGRSRAAAGAKALSPRQHCDPPMPVRGRNRVRASGGSSRVSAYGWRGIALDATRIRATRRQGLSWVKPFDEQSHNLGYPGLGLAMVRRKRDTK